LEPPEAKVEGGSRSEGGTASQLPEEQLPEDLPPRDLGGGGSKAMLSQEVLKVLAFTSPNVPIYWRRRQCGSYR